MNLYVPFDKVANDYLYNYAVVASSDASACRTLLPILLKSYPLPDIDLKNFGNIDSLKDKVITVSWTSYRFPEDKAENLAPLGASEVEVKQAFNEKNDKLIHKED